MCIVKVSLPVDSNLQLLLSNDLSLPGTSRDCLQIQSLISLLKHTSNAATSYSNLGEEDSLG
jgi:hypothetical protein